MIEKTRLECIDCNLCKKNCLFLQKYNMNLKEFTYKIDLRYRCFMCGKCKSVCPKDLSGTEIAFELRKSQPENTLKTEFLKNDYKFKNLPKRKTDTLLFLGCNYPGFYPKTSEKLIDICKKMGIDFSVDCCKKPVYEQGGNAKFSNIENMLEHNNTKTLICACPNCYHLLKRKLNVNVISVFQFLYENGIGKKIKDTPSIFFPCSDRYSREIFQFILHYIDGYNEPYKKINCCGLGGGAKKYEEDIIEETKKMLHKAWEKNIYTYCSSCSGIFKTYGLKNIKNFLSEILEVHEEVSLNYAKNVLKYKFKRHTK
ncbi:(Fe-S)-binding protein [Treponema pedis]|uniref:(Fe-S)-binding protein n=1 Tax=Treponema pedis TaxID=409322 RepID=A0A7S6WSH9_9SPIR|nr:(Fe-S)-binding protein [Treponema pedis]QOW61997.1 (Fe-S)-binding protein [Treponema pedis]